MFSPALCKTCLVKHIQLTEKIISILGAALSLPAAPLRCHLS